LALAHGFAVTYKTLSFEQALDKIVEMGFESVEISGGNYPGSDFCHPEILLKNDAKLRNFKKAVEDRGLFISAFDCHGNFLHPQKSIAEKHVEVQHNTVLLAEKLGVDRICTFSGCPGDHEEAKHPNWVTCAWPEEYMEIVEWQWKKKVIPFWKDELEFIQKHGIDKVAIEVHPGFVCYNPETLLNLRNEVGKAIGANLDPSHLFWQSIDVPMAIRKLGNSIYHFHAKDSEVDPLNSLINGTSDTKPYSDSANRYWRFRTVGYGQSAETWKKILSALRLVGYDYVLSMEHEDDLTSVDEGLRKGLDLLKQIVFREKGKI
jgi:sugar phosphate isomerase/epimerase